MKSLVGRADLVRALVLAESDAPDRMAELLGFRARPVEPAITPPLRSLEPRVRDGAAPLEPAEPEPQVDAPAARVPLRPIPFWRLTAVEYPETPTRSEEWLRDATAPPPPTPVPRIPTAADALPRHPPLRAWPRLWPELHASLANEAPSGTVDVPALIAALGAGHVIRRFPRKTRRRWPTRLHVIVDRGGHLIPFWRDQDEVLARLRRVCGHEALRVTRIDDGTPPSSGAGSSMLGEASAADPVLILGDLGQYQDVAARGRWLAQGRRARRAGRKLRALVPVPRDRWSAPVADVWSAMPWERRSVERGGLSVAPGSDARRARCERLLRLVSPAIRIELGLLRAVRLCLAASEADCGTEMDVYLHESVRRGHAVATALVPEAAARFREGLSSEPPELVERIGKRIREWHASLPRSIWYEEVLGLAVDPRHRAWLAADIREATAHFARLAHSLTAGATPPAADFEAEGAWFRRLERRVPLAVWTDPRFRDSLALTWGYVHANDAVAEMPPGVAEIALATLGAARRTERAIEIRQVGHELVLVPRPVSWPASEDPGSPVACVRTLSEVVAIETGPAGDGHQVRADGGRVTTDAATGLDVPRVAIRTERGRYSLERAERPEWASGTGRDRFGLWAQITVGDVKARLRWIPPGRFEMGSPESESGRVGTEGPVHTVTLTHGYWLGETPCTQALWEAVMGSNPSEFKSPDRPVENVSWDDCQRFLHALNERDEVWGLAARLPTEAEWEHACRAGTTTATYAGDLDIRGGNNAPLLHPIAWYGGNSGVDFELANGWDANWSERQFESAKAGTHPVARKEPNSWGLYDMLGNVYEWCGSWFGDYDAKPAIDPTGPSVGSHRVVRGGSWLALARRVRAANRLWNSPDDRHSNIGFRLARGQGAQAPGTGKRERPAGTAGKPAGLSSGRAGAGRAERAARKPGRKR